MVFGVSVDFCITDSCIQTSAVDPLDGLMLVAVADQLVGFFVALP